MAITAISSTNTGEDAGGSSYSVGVSIPTPASGDADDQIVVIAQYWAPAEASTGPPTAVTLLGAGTAGLTQLDSAVADDSVTSGSDRRIRGHFILQALRSDFVGGTLTITQGPVTTSPSTPDEMHLAVTTVTVGSVGAPNTARQDAYDGITFNQSVAVDGGYDIVVCTDTYLDFALTLSSAGSYTLDESRIWTQGGSSVYHRLGIATASDPVTACVWENVLGYTITGVAFADAAPVVPRGRRGLGLIHAPRIG